MSDERKIEVFKKSTENKNNLEFDSPSIEGLNTAKEIYVSSSEEKSDAQRQMDLEIERQMAAKKAGEAMGLRGNELIQYIIHSTSDISIREELSEDYGKEVGEILYSDDKEVKAEKQEVKNLEFSENEKRKIREEIEAEINESAEEELKTEQKNLEEIQKTINELLNKLSIKQSDAPFDYVKIPSLGKLYDNVDAKNGCIKVAFLNGSDEDVLTNPGILTSGKFLDVLFSRKLVEENIQYEDLIPADRDAIMLWLRSTAYGSNYPITVTDPKTEKEFQANIELDKLPIKYIELEINKNGFLDFTTPSGDFIEFKLLTVGDVHKLDEIIQIKAETMKGLYASSGSDEVLKLMVRKINGESDPEKILPKLKYMRMSDIIAFKDYLAMHDFGLDLKLKIKTPSKEVIETLFPFETHFFWPNI